MSCKMFFPPWGCKLYAQTPFQNTAFSSIPSLTKYCIGGKCQKKRLKYIKKIWKHEDGSILYKNAAILHENIHILVEKRQTNCYICKLMRTTNKQMPARQCDPILVNWWGRAIQNQCNHIFCYILLVPLSSELIMNVEKTGD